MKEVITMKEHECYECIYDHNTFYKAPYEEPCKSCGIKGDYFVPYKLFKDLLTEQ